MVTDMKRQYIPILLSAMLAATVAAAGTGFALESARHDFERIDTLSDIPREPGWGHPSYRGWEVMSIPGLISTYYDLDSNGELDYMVIRKVLRKVDAEKTTVDEAIETAKRDHVSVYFSNPVIYFTERYPLFYCLGVDYRRNCRKIWVDISEDGLNGNESLYTLSAPSPHVR